MTAAIASRVHLKYTEGMAKAKYYLTTPVYDATVSPRIEILFTAILGDAIARHRRMCGFDVAHVVAPDTRTVMLQGFLNRSRNERTVSFERNYRKFEELARLANTNATDFGSVSSAEHTHAVQILLRRIMRRSRLAIYKAIYEGRYCIHDQIDISDSRKPADCAICGRQGELISEERYFFRLSSFQGRLLALYKYRPEFVQPRVRSQETEHFIQKGLKDIPISSKSTASGVPWPDDPDHSASSDFSQLVSYISGLGFGKNGYGSDEFKRYWPANLHVIGKETLLSHAVYWPAFLMAADLAAPRHILAHSRLFFEPAATDDAFCCEELLQAFGSDALRYCLLREVPYDDDARLSFDGLVARYNADLANGFGSLAWRILMFVAQYCDGKIPTPSVLGNSDSRIESATADVRAEARFLFDHNNFSEGLKKIWSLIAIVDKALTENDPRGMTGEPGKERRFTDVLHDCCQTLALLTLVLHPVLPRATDAIWRSLGQTTRLENQLIDETPWCSLMPGTPIVGSKELFPPVGKAENCSSSLRNASLPRPVRT